VNEEALAHWWLSRQTQTKIACTTPIEVLPDDAPVRSEACRTLFLKNVIANLMTIVYILWLN